MSNNADDNSIHQVNPQQRRKKRKAPQVYYKCWKEPPWSSEALVRIPSPLAFSVTNAPLKRKEHLDIDSRIASRWTVKARLGHFGSHVYLAHDAKLRRNVAIKAHISDQTTLEKEHYLLKKMQHMQGNPKSIHCHLFPDSKPGLKFVVMTLLGPSIEALLEVHGSFSLGTVHRIGKQMLLCIDYLHTCGYVHRNIKPGNFLVGVPPNERQIYLVDFGEARSYLTRERCHVGVRRRPGFRGTMEYASPRAHEGAELSRRDDLWSLLLSMVACRARLPWAGNPHHGTVRESKLATVDGLVRRQLGGRMDAFRKHVLGLGYFDVPDYDLLNICLNRAIREECSKESALYEWAK